MRAVLRALAVLATPLLAGCWALIGESFTDYRTSPTGALEDSGGGGDVSTDALQQAGEAGEAATPDCGAPCTGANMICDPDDGKCKLDGTTSSVGAPCRDNADPRCGTAPNHACKDPGNDGFPAGYCTVTSCNSVALCPKGSTCADLTGESAAACYKICSTNADCRAPDYACYELGALYVSGAGTKICHPTRFQCYSAVDCPVALPACSADTDAGTTGFCGP